MIASHNSGAIFMYGISHKNYNDPSFQGSFSNGVTSGRYSVRKLSPRDKLYPRRLHEAFRDKSPCIYVKGDLNEGIFLRCLGVVGSRRMTRYGREVVKELLREIVKQGVTIVSGFMYGIDSEAHKVCIEAGGKTIAVMPCGVENVFPRENESLYRSVLDTGGLVVSEFCESVSVQKWCFPRRNRIVAGLSNGILVVEAGINSGSMITARICRELGRPLYAVPGNISSPCSHGTLHLIREGASMVCSTRDLYGLFGISEDVSASITSQGERVRLRLLESAEGRDPRCLSIYDNIQDGDGSIDELVVSTGFSVSDISVILTRLSLGGFIKEEGARYYAV